MKSALSKDLQELQKRHKGTIGIAGLDPNQVATLTKLIISIGSKMGLSDDQHFPEIIAVGINPKGDANKLRDQIHFCADQGCDVIAVTNDFIQLENMDGGLNIIWDSNLQDLAEQVLTIALNTQNPLRPRQYGFSAEELKAMNKTEEEAIIDAVNSDYRLISARIKARQASGGYSFLEKVKENLPVTGILGGAGPEASATFAAMLARDAVPHIHFSASSSPGKHRYEVENGPSYIPRYLEVVKIMNLLALNYITIPCNTAHKRLDKFLPESADNMLQLVDIREATLRAAIKKLKPGSHQIILLGTSATTGVNVPESRKGEKGVYQRFLDERYEEDPGKPTFIVPDSDGQNATTEAIYDVKAGRHKMAKEKILGVIRNLRNKSPNSPVILGCTELPLPFSETELMKYGLTDPAQEMARMVHQKISKSRMNPDSPPNIRISAFRDGSSSDSSDVSDESSPSVAAASSGFVSSARLLRPRAIRLVEAASVTSENIEQNMASYKPANGSPAFSFYIARKLKEDGSITYRFMIAEDFLVGESSLKDIKEMFRPHSRININEDLNNQYISFQKMDPEGIRKMEQLAAEHNIKIINIEKLKKSSPIRQ